MAETSETWDCIRGDAEDSNPLWCDTQSFGVYFPTSQKSHVPSEH